MSLIQLGVTACNHDASGHNQIRDSDSTLSVINRDGSRCGACFGTREYRDRSHERRSQPPAEAVRSQCGAGHNSESISQGAGKTLGAGSLDARSRDRASDDTRRVCRGRDHRGPAGVQRRAGIRPGGACPDNACRPEVAAGAHGDGPAEWRLDESARCRIGAWRHREAVARRRGCRRRATGRGIGSD